MPLKTKLVFAITTLVFLIAGLVSYVYISQLLHTAVEQSYGSSRMGAQQIWLALRNALETGLAGRTVNPNDPDQLRTLAADAIRSSAPLQSVIDSVLRYSPTVYDISIADDRGHVILSSNPNYAGQPLPARPDFSTLLNAGAFRLISIAYGPPRVYDITVSLDNNGRPLAGVYVGVRTSLLTAQYQPVFQRAILLMSFALLTALVVAFLLGNLALRPLEDISLRLDYWTAFGSAAAEERQPQPRADPVARVASKIESIGQRMRSVEEVYSALSENLDQLLSNLQDGILLFTAEGRAALVSEFAARFLGREQSAILNRPATEIFDPSTALGRTLLAAFASHQSIDEEIRTESGRRIQATVDFIRPADAARDLGALVALHDLESAEAVSSELELSRRLAAIGRLTSGVGHEVKNPINAIVLHLELLRNKLAASEAPAARHLDIIDSEIHRLDRVVQTLVDFSRPVELDLHEQDLRPVVASVLALAAEELAAHNVTLASSLPTQPLLAAVDADLLKQAVLNVVQNGAQAMPEGGRLTVALETDSGRTALIRIADQGPGIPAEIRDKIFNLYFTTKSQGSGIGLAMTYRILQLHHGSVEVKSESGEGAEFQLRIPLK